MAAAQDEPQAITALGVLHILGKGVAKDIPKGMDLLLKSAGTTNGSEHAHRSVLACTPALAVAYKPSASLEHCPRLVVHHNRERANDRSDGVQAEAGKEAERAGALEDACDDLEYRQLGCKYRAAPNHVLGETDEAREDGGSLRDHEFGR